MEYSEEKAVMVQEAGSEDNVLMAGVDEDVLTECQIKRNMFYCILLDAIFITGAADLAIALAPFLVWLGASNTVIGLVTGAQWATLLGVFLTPWITRRFHYKKWYMFVVHIPYLGAIGLGGLLIILAPQLGLNKPEMITATLLIFIAHWFFGGFVAVPHQEFVAACIPMEHRGRYTGLSLSIGSALAIGATVLGGIILARVEKPLCFGIIFLISWFLMQIGYIPPLFAKERPTPVELSPKPWTATMFKAVLADKPFLHFLIFIIANGITVGAAQNYVGIYGLKGLAMPATSAAVFQLINKIGSVGLSTPLGFLTDKLTPRKVFPYWTLVQATVLILPVIFPNQWGVYAAVCVSTILGAGYSSSYNALLFGLPKPEHRAGHFAVQMILWFIAISAGAIGLGRILDQVPYTTVFLVAAIIALLLFPYARYLCERIMKADPKAFS